MEMFSEKLDPLFVEEDRFEAEALASELKADGVEELLECISSERLWDEEAPGSGLAPVRAARVVAIERPDGALPVLYDVVFEAPPDSLLYTEVTEAIKAYGEEAVSPGVSALKSYGEPFREDLACLFAELGVQKRVVFQVILKHFVKNPHIGAYNLAEYGDPEGIDALEVVLDRYLVAAKNDPDQAETILAIAEAIETLGGDLLPEHRSDVEELRDKKSKSQEVIERVKRGERPGEQGEDTVVHDRDIGRNDPCWCGSDRKYKHCHWEEDNR